MYLHKINDEFTYVDEPYVSQNTFIGRTPEDAPLPTYEESRALLPHPVWEGHEDTVRAGEFAWKTAFGNLRRVKPGSGLVSNFIDTAFNDFLFMWDSSFIVMFGKYAARAFCFQHTLDNFYAVQHRDGFICREISEEECAGHFTRYDPSATGPNIMPWCEWEYYSLTGDKKRLAEVFPPLMAYHHWVRRHYTWRDGSYFSTGWGCGMDNQPRLEEGYHDAFDHGYMIWADACIQAVLSAKTLIKMARELGRESEAADMQEEAERLTKLINEVLWDDKTAFYYDQYRDGRLNGVKSIGAYWALLADVVPAERLDRFVAHLENEAEFNRPHRPPTLSADHEKYDPQGGYWCGGVWAPTSYMTLKGLERIGRERLAFEIAQNSVENVSRVFAEDGTLYENYAPESASRGRPAKSDFVGWSGLFPISVFYEYVLGIRADSAAQEIVWHVNLTERHGIENYPFGDAVVDLLADARKPGEKPVVHVRADKPVTVRVIWENGEETVAAEIGR